MPPCKYCTAIVSKGASYCATYLLRLTHHINITWFVTSDSIVYTIIFIFYIM